MRSFLKHLFLLQLLNWLVKPVWIFYIERGVQNAVGAEAYGQYFVALNLCLLFSLLLDFGINNYLTTKIAAQPHTANQIFLPILFLRLMMAGAFALVVAGAGLFNQIPLTLLAWVILNQILASTVLYFRAALQGLHKFSADAWVSITDRLVAIIFCGIALQSPSSLSQLLQTFIFAQGAGYLAALLLACFFINPFSFSFKYPPQEKVFKIFKTTLWFALLAFSMGLFTRIDALMLKHLSSNGNQNAGIYAQSFRLLDAALIFSSLISTQLLPLFAASLSKNESPAPLAWLSTRIILFVALPAACSAVFFGNPLMSALYAFSSPLEMEKSILTFAFILSAFIPMALIHVYGTLLTASNQLKWLVKLSLACALLNVLINFWLIPKLESPGAAIACLITQSIFAFACWWKCKNTFSLAFKPHPTTLTWATLSVVLFMLVALFSNHSALGWFIAISVYPLWTLLSGVFRPELTKLWK